MPAAMMQRVVCEHCSAKLLLHASGLALSHRLQTVREILLSDVLRVIRGHLSMRTPAYTVRPSLRRVLRATAAVQHRPGGSKHLVCLCVRFPLHGYLQV